MTVQENVFDASSLNILVYACSEIRFVHVGSTPYFFSNMTSLLFFFLEAHFWVTFHFNSIFRLREIVPSGLENFCWIVN